MSKSEALSRGSHTIVVGGLDQHYHVAGSGPVCILHSGGPGIDPAYLRSPALEQHFTTVYVEPIGTGRSSRLPDHPGGYTIDRYVHMLHGLVEHLGEPEVIVLGHSHGGFVAQRYAAACPDRVAGIVLYDSAPTAGGDLFMEATRKVGAFSLRHAGLPDAQKVAECWKGVGGIVDDAGYTAAIRELFPLYFADYWAREAEFDALRSMIHASFVTTGGVPFENRDQLDAIKTPTLVLVGQHDFICGLRWAEMLRDGIAGAELLVFSNSGHFAHLEETEGFIQAVAGFAGKVGAQ